MPLTGQVKVGFLYHVWLYSIIGDMLIRKAYRFKLRVNHPYTAAFENTLTERMIEIGAGDLDDEDD